MQNFIKLKDGLHDDDTAENGDIWLEGDTVKVMSDDEVYEISDIGSGGSGGTLGRNSVGTNELKDDAVTTAKIFGHTTNAGRYLRTLDDGSVAWDTVTASVPDPLTVGKLTVSSTFQHGNTSAQFGTFGVGASQQNVLKFTSFGSLDFIQVGNKINNIIGALQQYGLLMK